MDAAIESTVHIAESGSISAIQDLTVSERYGTDIDDVSATEGVDDEPGVVVQHSAVLPAPRIESSGHGIVDALLAAVSRDASGGSATPAQQQNQPPVIPIKRGCSPIVEWLENAKMLAGAFPELFLTGSRPLPSGPLPHGLVDHFMHYWDGRFEKSTRFLAVLFNQMQRHTAVRNAARMGSARSSTLRSFGKIASTPEFRTSLEFAKAHPDSPKAVRLNAMLLRLLSVVGGSVPFSPFERAATRPKLGAMRYRYGVGQHWVTMAPPEQDDLLLHRIAQLRGSTAWNDSASRFTHRSCRLSDLPDNLASSPRARLSVSNLYPALSAQVFERRLQAFTKCLVRCCDSSSTRVSRNYHERECGLYGRVAGFNAVVEPQMDGRLHAHAIIYGSTVTPALLTRAASCPGLWDSARTWIGSVSCTSISPETRNWMDEWREANDGRTPRAFDISVPDASTNFGEFMKAAEKRTLSTNVHTHSQTCRKGIRGKDGCRLSRPAGIHPDETQPLHVVLKTPSHLGKRKRAEFSVRSVADELAAALDLKIEYRNKRIVRERTNGAVVWEQRRPSDDAMFVETNLALACLLKSHTNSSLINGLDAGDMVEEYQHAYMTKEKGGLKSSVAVMLTALQDIEKYPSVAEDSGTCERQAKHLATRTVNAFTGSTEWPHQLMAYALAGYRSYISSDTFWYVFPHQLVSYVADEVGGGGLNGDEGGICEVNGVVHGDENDVDLNIDVVGEYGELNRDGNEFNAGLHENEGEGTADSLSSALDISDRLDSIIHEAADEALPTSTRRSGGARMFTINKKVVFVTQAESYRHRGASFEAYSPIEFEMIVDLLPRRDVEVLSSNNQRGRPKRQGFDLAPGHPLSQHFQGFIRTKFLTPMFGGAPIPSLKEDGSPSEAFAKYVLCLVTPWRLETGKPERGVGPDELLNLCRDWNRTAASFVDKQRYRVIDNILQTRNRSSKNEKTCSEWRNRNADIWAEQARPPQEVKDADHSGSGEFVSDREAAGMLLPEELFELTVAASARDVKASESAKRMRSTFWSLVPDGDLRRIGPDGSADPIFIPSDGSPSLSHISRRIRTMPSVSERARGRENDIDTHHRGENPPDPLAGRWEDQDRCLCSSDQQEVYDRIVGSIDSDGRFRQTLTVLHGGGGTGKSWLLRLIAGALKRRGAGTINTCPTGVGACHLPNGRTFHSAFKTFRKGDLTSNDLELLRLTFTKYVAVVVVDEMSMFCAEFLVLLDRRLRAIYRTNVVFGGRSIVLAGDFLQLDVTVGTPLCKVLGMATDSNELISARALFRQFAVFFLDRQHRAAGCQAQQSNLSAFRVLPSFFPSGQRWSAAEAKSFSPLTPGVIDSITNELTLEDVENDPAWLDDKTILVTNNVDKAILTACAAKLYAKRQVAYFFAGSEIFAASFLEY